MKSTWCNVSRRPRSAWRVISCNIRLIYTVIIICLVSRAILMVRILVRGLLVWVVLFKVTTKPEGAHL